MSGHLTETELRAFRTCRCTPGELQRINGHLEACEFCHDRLAVDADAAATAFTDALQRTNTISQSDAIAYLSGTLEADERERFEAVLATVPELWGELALLSERLPAIETKLSSPVDFDDVVGEASVEGLRSSFAQARPLSLMQQRALFTDAELRGEYNRLIKQDRLKPPPRQPLPAGLVGSALPARIAASTDRKVVKREFAGGSLNISSGGRPYLTLLRINTDAKTSPGTGLALHGPDGSLAYVSLPFPDADGLILKMLDLRKASDAVAAELLTDLLATGEFVTL
jgi:hypothetical protein